MDGPWKRVKSVRLVRVRESMSILAESTSLDFPIQQFCENDRYSNAPYHGFNEHIITSARCPEPVQVCESL